MAPPPRMISDRGYSGDGQGLIAGPRGHAGQTFDRRDNRSRASGHDEIPVADLALADPDQARFRRRGRGRAAASRRAPGRSRRPWRRHAGWPACPAVLTATPKATSSSSKTGRAEAPPSLVSSPKCLLPRVRAAQHRLARDARHIRALAAHPQLLDERNGPARCPPPPRPPIRQPIRRREPLRRRSALAEPSSSRRRRRLRPAVRQEFLHLGHDALLDHAPAGSRRP